MKTWFSSLSTAIMFSTIALLTELWRAWLDMLFEYPSGNVHAQIDGGSTLAVTLIYTAVFAGWAYSLHSATRDSRGALIATLVFNIIIWLAMPVGWTAFYCTGDCSVRAGILYNIANWLNLIFGVLAAMALTLQLRPSRAAG